MKELTREDYQRRILEVLVHIQENLDRPLLLEQLARVAHFSPYHFHRIFRGMVGETLKGHIRRIRLERAATRLKLSTSPVQGIAKEAGYQSLEAFSRAFRSELGLAPTEYRAARQVPAFRSAPSGVHFQAGSPPADLLLHEDQAKEMKVSIKHLEPCRVAFMRHSGPYDECGRTWDELLARLGSQGHLGPGTVFLGLCHDDPEVTEPGKLRYDACVSVDGTFSPRDNLGVQTIPGGDFAVATHQGPYSALGEAYAALFGQWLPRSGRRLRPLPCFEVYLNSPDGTEPEELLTDIHVPLEPLAEEGA